MKYVVENRRKNKAFKIQFSSFFDDSVAAVCVLRSDQSARYSTFFTANCEKSGIARWLVSGREISEKFHFSAVSFL